MMDQLPAAGFVNVHVSVLPAPYGRQSKAVSVGCEPKRTYSSASPVPPLICTVSDACPAGTLMKKNCCAFSAPERLETGTPLASSVSPPDDPAVTVSEAVAECAVAPDVPVTVNVAVAADAAAAAVSVSVELPPAVTEVGLNAPVTPAGSPDTDQVTVCALPLITVVAALNVVDDPAATVRLPGETETPK